VHIVLHIGVFTDYPYIFSRLTIAAKCRFAQEIVMIAAATMLRGLNPAQGWQSEDSTVRGLAAVRHAVFAAISILLLAACNSAAERSPEHVESEAAVRPVGVAPAPSNLSALVERAAPAVVNIAILQASPAQQNPLMQDPYFRRFFDLPEESSQPRLAAGSGVIVDGARGLILTNAHVVTGAQAIEVMLPDRRRFEARHLGSDPATDIALLQIRAPNLPQLPLGNSDATKVGDQVVAIGNPFGLGQTVTSGIVSALGRGLREGGYESYIQTDAPINPGNSGGPLIDLSGTVVGINSAIFGPGANIGIGFAVPSATAGFVMQQILQHGAVQRGQIGVMLNDTLPPVGTATTPVKGALIAAVEPRSTAARAGLRKGDIVTAVDAQPTPTATSLRNLVGRTPIGTAMTLTVRRDARTFEARIAIEPRS
jgi:serine protease DegQ